MRDETILEAVQRCGSQRSAARELGITRWQVRQAIDRTLAKSGQPPRSGEGLLPRSVVKPKVLKPGGVYILTCAQNDVKVNEPFFQCLLRYAERRNAQLMIAPVVYDTSETRNTKDRNEKTTEYSWDDRIKPFLVERPIRLAPTFEFTASLNILPTAANPLSGIDFPPQVSSAVPHQKRALECSPVARHGRPVYRYTTGSCTQPRHVQKKAGQRAEFHHVAGALIVEVDSDGAWFCRQISANTDGSFYDLHFHVTKGYSAFSSVDHLVCGDIHFESVEERILNATFHDKISMVHTLAPQAVVLHDYWDGRSVNPHASFGEAYQQHMANPIDSVCQELARAVWGLARIQAATEKAATGKAEVVVAASNHDDGFLSRWLNTHDYRSNPEDSLMFLKLETMRLEAILKKDGGFNILREAMRIAVNDKALDKVRFLNIDESYQRCKIELGMHGHIGPHGSRGNARSLSKVAEKITMGHTHVPQIREGVFVAGHSCKRKQGYNRGVSAWDFAHVVGYRDGHRATITFWEDSEDKPLRWKGRR